jgi:uncharacterized membrane protein (Fun14 family)
VVITTSKGVMCNWAKFVNGQIHEELAVKKKVGKVNILLCGHYLSLVIQYCTKASKVNPEKTRLANVLSSSWQKTIALEDCLESKPKGVGCPTRREGGNIER